jgi:prepilin-type N-terminal cleavage/methylation domain-containing protein
MKKTFFSQHRTKGFTIIELMVALTVLTLLSLGAARIYLNYTASTKDLKAANLIYEEARFLMEKMVREVRQGAIDYEQYFNQNLAQGDYGDNYCGYDQYFYDNNGESIGRHNEDMETDFQTNLGMTDAVRAIEDELYLINVAGNRRTILTRLEKEVEGETIGKVAITKLVGQDYGADHINAASPQGGGPIAGCDPDERENDGLIDTWLCDPDFPCKRDFEIINGICTGHTDVILNDPADPDHSFVDISPNALNIIDLKFIISPKDDPWKAYNIDEIQIQPHVTIQLTVEANPKLITTDTERIPSITLTSTVTTRNYDEIKSPCGL